MPNNREIATLFWLAVFVLICVVWALRSDSFSSAVRGLLSSMVQWKVLVIVAASALWVAGGVWLAWRIGVWTPELLAPTLFWGVPATYTLGFLAVQASKEENYFRSAARQVVTIALALELLVNIEPFALGWELLLFPMVLALVLLEGASKLAAVNVPAQVQSCLSALVAVVGILLLVGALVRFIARWSHHDWPIVVRSLALGVWLPALAMPLVYLLSLIMLYETLLTVRLPYASVIRPRRALSLGHRLGIMLGLGPRRRLLVRLNGPSGHEWRTELAAPRTLRQALADARALRAKVTVSRSDQQPRRPRSAR